MLNNINITVNSGECIGILGDNGSGKSTLLSIFAGMLNQTSGQILLNGKEISKNKRAKISYVPQEPILMEDLTVKDNLKLWAGVYKVKNFKDVLNSLPEFLGINEILKEKVKNLSGGTKKKISIAIALINNPDFIIMDEAFASLDLKTINELILYLKKFSNLGILYSSHNLNEIKTMCNKIIVLKNGNINYKSLENEQFNEKTQEFLLSKF